MSKKHTSQFPPEISQVWIKALREGRLVLKSENYKQAVFIRRTLHEYRASLKREQGSLYPAISTYSVYLKDKEGLTASKTSEEVLIVIDRPMLKLAEYLQDQGIKVEVSIEDSPELPSISPIKEEEKKEEKFSFPVSYQDKGEDNESS